MLRAECARADRIDVAAIVTPNHLHHAAAKTISRRGLPCHLRQAADDDGRRRGADLLSSAERARRVLAVTYNYSGYPLVRQAREMIAAGELGELRVVQVEYAQDWLTTPLEAEGQKQAVWRTDPQQSGAAGAVGDIGTHAFHLAEFVTRIAACRRLAADLSTQVAGRKLDDNAQMLLRFANGARGALWVSQVAPGNENGLRLRIYGEKGGLEWSQEAPNHLRFAPYGEQPRVITRGGAGADAARCRRRRAFRPVIRRAIIEAFAQVYRDIADLIAAYDAKARAAGRRAARADCARMACAACSSFMPRWNRAAGTRPGSTSESEPEDFRGTE